jgi:hypothetical protein
VLRTTPAAGYTINNDNSITAVSAVDSSGTSPDTMDVTVVSAGGTSFTSSNDQYTFDGQPSVVGVSPNRGPLSGGYYVTVTGTNFVGTTAEQVMPLTGIRRSGRRPGHCGATPLAADQSVGVGEFIVSGAS